MTHFSEVRDIPFHQARMHRLIDAYAVAAQANAANQFNRERLIRAELDRIVLREAREQGITISDDDFFATLDLDLRLNAQGLVAWLDADAPRG